MFHLPIVHLIILVHTTHKSWTKVLVSGGRTGCMDGYHDMRGWHLLVQNQLESSYYDWGSFLCPTSMLLGLMTWTWFPLWHNLSQEWNDPFELIDYEDDIKIAVFGKMPYTLHDDIRRTDTSFLYVTVCYNITLKACNEIFRNKCDQMTPQ